jgi:hypothetical protein
MNWVVASMPTGILAFAILAVHLSGNDKAPVFVFLALLIGAIIQVGMCVLALTVKREPKL